MFNVDIFIWDVADIYLGIKQTGVLFSFWSLILICTRHTSFDHLLIWKETSVSGFLIPSYDDAVSEIFRNRILFAHISQFVCNY